MRVSKHIGGAILGVAFLGLVAIPARAEDNTVMTVDGVTSNVASYILGSTGTNNTLSVLNGGRLVNTGDGIIGNAAGASNNIATVNGSGAIWTNTGSLIVGNAGSGNRLTISNGAFVAAQGQLSTIIGNGTRNNIIIVTGTGSLLTNTAGTASLNIAYGGGDSNSLVISNGGRVYSSGANSFPGRTSISYGSSTARGNMAIVTDPGSLWTVGYGADGFITGGAGSMIIVSNGGTLASIGISVGWGGGDTTILVTGTGSTWNAGTINWNGGANPHHFIMTNGGKIVASGMSYRSSAGAGLAVTVAGTNSLLTSGTLYMGSTGPGDKLNILNGGTATTPDARLGYGTGFTNTTATIADPGSVWTNSSLVVGDSAGNNRVVIRDGGKVVCNGACTLGNALDVNYNSVSVTNGGIFQVSGALAIGGAGGAKGNALTVSSSGQVTCAGATIGNAAGADTNAAAVGGPGSSWNLGGGNLALGSGGGVSNVLTLDTGGTVTNVGTLTINAGNMLNLFGGPLTATTLTMEAGAQIGLDLRASGTLAVSGTATMDGTVALTTNLPRLGNVTCTILTCGTPAGPGLAPPAQMPTGYRASIFTNAGSPYQIVLKVTGPAVGTLVTIR